MMSSKLLEGTFAGRAEELAALEALRVRGVAQSAPVAGMVIADAGMGKTRLLAALAAHLPPSNTIALRGYQPEQHIPLAAARGLLARLRTDPAVGGIIDEVVFAATRSELAEPIRLFEAAHHAASALGDPVVLVDDVQWADELSIALLHYLVRAAESARSPLALITAGRPDPAVIALRDSLHLVVGDDRFVAMTLGPLDRDAGIRLVLALQPQCDNERAAALWEVARGSPFWLALLAHSDRSGINRVEDAIVERLRIGGEDAAAMVALLAMTGRPVATDDVSAILDWPVDRVERSVAAVIGHGLATRTFSGITLAHDLIREAAIRTLSSGLARRMHRALSDWLEANAGSDDQLLLEALEHRRTAGGDGVGLATRLARSPRRRLLGRPGLKQLVAVATEADRSRRETRVLEQALAELAHELGDHREAFRLWSEQISAVGDPTSAARAALHASEAALELEWSEEAATYLERARLSAVRDRTLQVEILAQESAVERHLRRRPDLARTTAARACQDARALLDGAGGFDQVDDRTRRAWLRAVLTACEGALEGDDPDELLALAGELQLAAAGVDDHLEVEAIVVQAFALRFQGRNRDAEDRLRRAWGMARARVLPLSVFEVATTLGHVLLSMGRIDAAREVHDEIAALGTRLTEFRPARALAIALPSLIEFHTGRWQSAIEGLHAAAAGETVAHYRLHAHLALAVCAARLDTERYRDLIGAAITAALDDAMAAGCRRCLNESTVTAAEVLARTGAVDEARALLDGVEVPARDALISFMRLRANAAVAAASGDIPTAVAGFDAVVAQALRQELGLEAMWGRVDLGVTVARSDRRRGAAILREAGVAADALGATTGAQVVERALRSLGVRTWRRGAQGAVRSHDPLDMLTVRERDIARLVAAGASNPEIAAAVFLSRKTVERHVSNILAKVGARNRAELAAVVAEAPAPLRQEP